MASQERTRSYAAAPSLPAAPWAMPDGRTGISALFCPLRGPAGSHLEVDPADGHRALPHMLCRPLQCSTGTALNEAPTEPEAEVRPAQRPQAAAQGQHRRPVLRGHAVLIDDPPRYGAVLIFCIPDEQKLVASALHAVLS